MLAKSLSLLTISHFCFFSLWPRLARKIATSIKKQYQILPPEEPTFVSTAFPSKAYFKCTDSATTVVRLVAPDCLSIERLN